MSFAEFQIRLFAWKRTQDREWEKIRLVAWYSLTGPHQNPKRLPKSMVNFLPLSIDKKENTLTDAHKSAFLEAVKDYEKQVKLQ